MERIIQYQSYIRNNWPLPFVEPWAWGPTNVAKPPFQWKFILTTHFGDKSGWHYHAKELLKLGHAIDRHLANPRNLKKFVGEAVRVKQENLLFAKRIARLRTATLSSQQLTSLLREWHTVHSCFVAAYMPIDATDETLEGDIRKAIRKSGLRLAFDDIVALLTPNAPTYVQKEHKDFCALAKRFAGRSTFTARRAIVRHTARWWWTVMGWGQYRPLDEKTVMKNLRNISDMDALLSAQKHDDRLRAASLRRKRKLLATLPQTIRRLLDAFEVLAEMHDTRKEMQMKMMWACFSITEALLKKFRIPASFRDYMLIGEYLQLERGVQPAHRELRSRMKAYWCQTTADGKVMIFSGKKAIARLRQSKIYKRKSETKFDVVRGIPASPGVVRGKVRVGLNPHILIRSLQAGEILVTSQTTPDFAPIMKKAGAIVTNEGGVTSHAAIVSRELKKPCVIGTKIATEVLKDGDVVEVNANHGVVTVIKRK